MKLLLDTATQVPNFGVFEQLTNYGVLGIAVLALGAAAWYMIKRQLDEKDRLLKKLDDLQNKQ